MTLLADLIKNRKPERVATAIPATYATRQVSTRKTIARIANVAIAVCRNHKSTYFLYFPTIFVWACDCARYYPILLANFDEPFFT